MTLEQRIEALEQRVALLEKTIAVLTTSEENTRLSKLLCDAPVLYSADFTKENSLLSGWNLYGAEDITFNKGLHFRSAQSRVKCGTYHDPIFESPDITLDASSASVLEIWFDSSVEVGEKYGICNIFFRTESDNTYSESKKLQWHYTVGPNNYLSLFLPQHAHYRGTITGIRLDLLESAGTILIKKIQMSRDGTPNSETALLADFTKSGGFRSSGFRFSNCEVLTTNGGIKLHATPVDRYRMLCDPILVCEKMNLDIDATNARYVRARFRVIGAVMNKQRGRIYFKTAQNDDFSQDKSVEAEFPGNTMTEALFDMRKNAAWFGLLTGIRLDPVEALADISVESLEILSDTPLSMVAAWQTDLEERVALIAEDVANDAATSAADDAVFDAVEEALEDCLEEKVRLLLPEILDDLEN